MAIVAPQLLQFLSLTLAPTGTLFNSHGFPKEWNATITGISSLTSTSSSSHNGTSVVEGDYIATDGKGRALKVTNIASSTTSTLTCTVVDDEEINSYIDENGSSAITASGTGSPGIIFQIRNGLPVLYATPLVSSYFDPSFISQLISRFSIHTLPIDPITFSNLKVNSLGVGKDPSGTAGTIETTDQIVTFTS